MAAMGAVLCIVNVIDAGSDGSIGVYPLAYVLGLKPALEGAPRAITFCPAGCEVFPHVAVHAMESVCGRM